MLRYLGRRLVAAAVLVAVVSSGALVLVRLAPGDFASELFGSGATAQSIARDRARYGLDQPLPTQYLRWLAGVARLDFGTSLLYRRPVIEMIGQRALNTSLLALAALLLATAIGIPAGVVSGSRRSGWTAQAIRIVSVGLLSLPSLLTSLLLMLVAVRSGWFPIGGMQSMALTDAGLAARLADVARHVFLPALAIALPLAASIEQLQGQAMEETVAMPFTLAALARGVPRRRLIWRDALRPALAPVASIYGFVIGSLLSGSFVVEVVTRWPGLGRLMWEALRARDLYLVAGCAAAGSVFLAIGSVLSDVALAWADPRLRGRDS